jgi:FKBP-type peptidyl-prolyl cis-trans isomerase FklB
MKIQISLAALLLCSGSLYAKDITTKSTEAEQVGYSFGYLMGRNNADSLKGINLDAFSAGLKAAAAGQKASLTEEEMAKVLMQYKRQADNSLKSTWNFCEPNSSAGFDGFLPREIKYRPS